MPGSAVDAGVGGGGKTPCPAGGTMREVAYISGPLSRTSSAGPPCSDKDPPQIKHWSSRGGTCLAACSGPGSLLWAPYAPSGGAERSRGKSREGSWSQGPPRSAPLHTWGPRWGPAPHWCSPDSITCRNSSRGVFGAGQGHECWSLMDPSFSPPPPLPG